MTFEQWWEQYERDSKIDALDALAKQVIQHAALAGYVAGMDRAEEIAKESFRKVMEREHETAN